MLIRTIKLKNFRQYKDAEIEFALDKDRNTTVILGENGYGKTTLIRAFNWCLYQTNDFKHDKDLLNSQVADDMPCDSDKMVKVTINIEHHNREYTIVTQEKYHKNSDGTVVKKDKKPTTIVTVIDENNDVNDCEGAHAHNIIESILKEEMREFFFYDGESNGIDEISNKKSLKNAISIMMKIKNVEILRNLFDEKKPHVIKALNNEIYKDGMKSGEDFDFNLADIKTKIENAEKEIEKNNKTKDRLKDELDRLNNQVKGKREFIKANEQSKEYQLEIEGLEKKNKEILDGYEVEYSKFIDKLGNKKSHALLNGLFEKCYNKCEIGSLKEKSSFQSEDSLSNITEDAVNQLIERGRCLCGAVIKDGNDAYNHLIEAKNHMEPHDYAAYLTDFMSLQNSTFEMNRDILDQFVASFNKDFLGSLDNYGANIERIGELKIKVAGSTNVRKVQEDLEKILVQIGEKKKELKIIEEETLPKYQEEIKIYQDKLKKAISKKEEFRVVSKCLDISNEIYRMASTHVKKTSSKVRETLENETNILFKRMYHGNRSITIDNDFNVKTITDQKELDNSTGIDTVKNFAFVTGMMKTAKKKIVDSDEFGVSSDDDYPLVIDAPFSNTDEEHIKKICDVLPESCDQLIMCMIHKDYKVAKDDLNDKIGRKYQIVKLSETEDIIEEVD